MATETAHAHGHQHEDETPAREPILIVRTVEEDMAIPKDLAATPRLTYRHGPLLTAVEVFTVFWGADWQKPAEAALIPRINQFFTDILKSSLMTELAEYSTKAHKIGPGKYVGSATVPDALSGTVQDASIRPMLQNHIGVNGGFPPIGPNMLYFVYLPSGIVVSESNQNSCQVFCGYHDVVNQNLFYAVMPYPDCTGCLRGLDVFNSLTQISSHELCESITDPVPGSGWYNNKLGEIGDICNGQTKQIGQYTVQMEWSNKARHCV